MYTAVYSANTLCLLISMMSYYCNGYYRGCIRLPEAVRGHAQLNAAVKESRMLKIVGKNYNYMPSLCYGRYTVVIT